MAMNGVKGASGGGFKMKPGSKGKDTPTTYRADSPLKALGFNMSAPGGYGSPVAERKKRTGRKTTSGGRKYKGNQYAEHMAKKKKSPATAKAKRGPQTKNVGGVRVSYMTKGRNTKNTDLLEVGKKAYKSAKKKAKSYYNKAKKWLKS